MNPLIESAYSLLISSSGQFSRVAIQLTLITLTTFSADSIMSLLANSDTNSDTLKITVQENLDLFTDLV